MKVLIAEDEPVSRRLLESFLRKWGYDVLVTCDGSEAWEALNETESPNLVVSDWSCAARSAEWTGPVTSTSFF